MSDKEPIVPVKGMGASSSNNGDSYPYTVVEVINAKTIRVTADDYKVKTPSPYSEGPKDCEFTTNWDELGTIYTKRKNGRWIMKGSSLDAWWLSISLGGRYYSQNPHI
jgi:hypothetical protein